jgi:hypothetical protein
VDSRVSRTAVLALYWLGAPTLNSGSHGPWT